MEESLHLALSEMLTARLCHELISPVGAIANGVEILDEEPDFAADATRLIADSTRSVSRRLQFYREAYGSRAGGTSRARAVTLDFFADSKILCDWPETVDMGPPGVDKLACNLMLLASEALPRGGRLSLSITPHGLPKVTGTGEGANVGSIAGLLEAPVVSIDQLTPRTSHGIFTRFLAERLALTIACQDTDRDEISLIVRPQA